MTDWLDDAAKAQRERKLNELITAQKILGATLQGQYINLSEDIAYDAVRKQALSISLPDKVNGNWTEVQNFLIERIRKEDGVILIGWVDTNGVVKLAKEIL